MATLNIFIHGRHYGSAPCPSNTIGQVFVCPDCGEPWATLAVSPQFMALGSTAWVPLSRLCDRHKPTTLSRFPGSLLPDLSQELLKLLPLPALLWEFERHWKTYERIQNEHES